jgi:RNA polymerase-binding transcription factor
MNTQKYKERLLELAKNLSARTDRSLAAGRGELMDSAHDSGDASVADEEASQQFREAGQDASVLQQVRDALIRIDYGTFGVCVVDGEPIEEKRLDAVPWASHCLRHAEQLEATSSRRMPTL